MNGVLIAGTASGVGKTTISLAIIAALRRRGHRVQSFKGGPDFLDTGHHSRIAGRIARNVDTWMLSEEDNLQVVRDASRDADFILVEGMMGLFDGKAGATDDGSSAEIAKLLKLPVILVLDASKSARSIAATVLGFGLFDSELPLAGVILNRVAGDRHFKLLESAITGKCATPILGWLPREESIAIPERHLGLRTVEESATGAQADAEIAALADLAEKYFDLDRTAELKCGLDFQPRARAPQTPRDSVRIGVARDAAFSFYYEDNLDLLREQGATIVTFSPLADTSLPENLDAVYLGGGYPELYATTLAANQSMLISIRNFAASGRPVYAECGGMIYLATSLTATGGTKYSMAGVLPFEIEMMPRLSQFGYATVTLTRDCLLGGKGLIVRGHSFHYSRLIVQPDLSTNYHVEYSLSGKNEEEGFSNGNVLASYIHLHFGAEPSIAKHLVDIVAKSKSQILVSA